MPDEFYDLTLYEYRCLICRYRFQTARKWEHTRRIVHAIFRSQSTKDIKVTEIMELLTDPQPKEFIPPTEEDKIQLKEKAQERLRAFANRLNK